MRIDKVTNVEKQYVEITTGEIFETQTDIFKAGDLVFVMPAGSLLPTTLAKQQALHKQHAKTTNTPHLLQLLNDTIMRVASVFPVEPYKRGSRETLALMEGDATAHADLLGVMASELVDGARFGEEPARPAEPVLIEMVEFNQVHAFYDAPAEAVVDDEE